MTGRPTPGSGMWLVGRVRIQQGGVSAVQSCVRSVPASAARLAAVAVVCASATCLLAALTPAQAIAAGCTDSWAKPVSGMWNTAADWSTGAVPTQTDEVCITTPGTYTVTLTENVKVKTLLLGAASGAEKQTLLVGGALAPSTALSLAGASTVGQAGILDLEGGSGTTSAIGRWGTEVGEPQLTNHGAIQSRAAAPGSFNSLEPYALDNEAGAKIRNR